MQPWFNGLFLTLKVVLWALLAVPAHAQVQAGPVDLAAAHKVAAGAPSPAMWAVDGGKGQVVLMGSIHLMKPGMAWLSPTLEQGVKEADSLILEIDRTPEVEARLQALVQEKGLYQGDGRLDQAVSPELYTAAQAIVAGLGFPAERLYAFRPWSAAMLIGVGATVKAGFDPQLGVEETLLRLARPHGVKIGSLETADEVIGALAHHPADVQAEMLRQAVAEYAEVDAMLGELTTAWAKGDVDALESLLVDRMREMPSFYDALMVGRNKAWMPRLRTVINTPGHHVVVVGASHLLGPDSLLVMLKDTGYKVRRIDR